MAKKKAHKKVSPRSHKNKSSKKDAQKMLLAGIGLVAILLLVLGGKTVHKSSDLSLKAMPLKPTTAPTSKTLPTSQSNLTNAPHATPTPTKTPNPTVNSSFQPIKPFNLLFGQITSADCNGISGFTFQVDNNGSPDILIMRREGDSHEGLGIGGPANLPSQDVDDFYHITGNHRFTHALLPDGMVSGKPYKYSVYAESSSSEFELVNSPVELTCP